VAGQRDSGLGSQLVFTGLIGITIGERISSRLGQMLCLPVLAAGVLSVWYWRSSGDVRAYLLVQFSCCAASLAVAAIPSALSRIEVAGRDGRLLRRGFGSRLV
jgi:hypothetical protein